MPPRTERAATLRRDLFHITTDGFFYCFMVGIAEMYFAKFVLALDLGAVASGLITTVPMMLGAALSLISPWLVKRIGSFSTYNALTSGIQATMLLPLAACAIGWPWIKQMITTDATRWIAAGIIFLLTTLYFFGSLATSAPWMTVTGQLIPASILARYTAKRLRLLQGATLAALLLHGFLADGVGSILTRWKLGPDPVLAGFGVAFLIGSVCRFISSWHLYRYSTPRSLPHEQDHVHASDFFKRFKHGNDGRFLIYAIAGNCALQIAQPYFNPYMLDQIRYSGGMYQWIATHLGSQVPYSLLLAAVYLGRVVMLSPAGAIAHRHGAIRPMWIGGLALPLLAVFWLGTSNYSLLLLGQVATGAALGAWELGVFLMNFESIAPSERTAMITYFTLANECGKTGGSVLGSAVLSSGGKEHPAYAWVFWVSCVARVAVLGLLARCVNTRDVRHQVDSDKNVGKP